MSVQLQIDVQPVPSQNISAVVNNQNCVIKLRQLGDERQYFSLSVAGVVICQNVLIQHGIPLSSAAYSGFIGDFYCVDLNGTDYPDYTQWGVRWVLLYNAA